MYEMSCQSRFDARYWMLGAGALGRPRGMGWGGRREEGSGRPPKFPNIPVSLQGNTEIPGVSREVPCSVLKCETVFDTLMRRKLITLHS